MAKPKPKRGVYSPAERQRRRERMIKQREAGLMVPLSRQTKPMLMATVRRKAAALGLGDEEIQRLVGLGRDGLVEALSRLKPAIAEPTPVRPDPPALEAALAPHSGRTDDRTQEDEHDDWLGELKARIRAERRRFPERPPAPLTYEQLGDEQQQSVRAANAHLQSRSEAGGHGTYRQLQDWRRRHRP